MSNWGKRLFGLSLLLFVIGASGLVWLFSKQEYFSFSLAKVDEQRTISQAITALDVSTDTTDVVVTSSNLKQASVRLVGEVSDKQKGRIQFLSEVTPDGTLKVEVREQPHIDLFFPGNGRLQLQVLIPEAQYEKIRMETATGDVETRALSAKTANIHSSTGDVEMDGYTGERLDVITETGDMKLANIRSILSIDSSTGEINKLQLSELTHDVDIQTDTGDVRISVDKEPAAVNLELESDTGDIDADWASLSYESKEEHHVKASVGNGGPTLTVRSSTGDIRIQ
jgi:lia operon protein LiaG